MGNGSAGGSAHARSISKAIDDELTKHGKQLRRTIKLLLLGAAECGKSTVLKQLKIFNNRVFADDEIESQRSVIYGNIVTFILVITDAMVALNVAFEETKRLDDVRTLQHILHAHLEHERPGLNTVAAVKRLWADKGVQECYNRRDEYQLSDSAKYFLDSVDRIADCAYVPNEQDILRARAATLGIVEVHFEMRGIQFKVFDVGGQRSERKKWIHCFDSVNAIIFIISMADYNLLLQEDAKTNRMKESIVLFDSVCNCNYFIKTSIILFLNKKDIFEEKIKKIPLTVTFKEYTGPQTYEASADFIEDVFIGRNRNVKRSIYPHQTCGTDTTQVQFVLQSVLDTIFSENMKTSGLVT